MSKFTQTIGSAGLALALLAGSANARELNVVASFTVLGDIVGEVGGANVHVKTLVGPDGDPHVFEPRPADADAVAKADLVFVNGLGLEGWIDRLITASGTKGKVVVLSQGVAKRSMVEDGKTVVDPHAWNSAANGAIYAENAKRALAAADPEDAAAITASGDRYVAQLKALDAWAKSEIAAVPPERRKVITSHDAIGYLGAAYGIRLLAAQGLSTEAEPTAGQIATLIRQIRAEKVKAVFIENQTDPRLVTQVAREGGAKIGGELYPEALTGPEGPAPTYVKMFTTNITALKDGMLAP